MLRFTAVYSEDYLLRHIQQLAGFIARIAGLNRNEAYDQALAAAERAWSKLLEAPRALIDAVDTQTLAGMLREPAKIRAAAQLCVEEARALTGKGDPRGTAARSRRALELFLEVRAMDPSEQDDAAIHDLLRVVPVATLAPRYRTWL